MFTDPGTLDTFTLTVNWGEGAPVAYPIAAGIRSFSVSHQYLDDNPTVTAFDNYPVSWTITDDDTGSDNDSGTVRVNNVPPSALSLTLARDSIDEGELGAVRGTFTDPGTLDTHSVDIDWGDGSTHTVLSLRPRCPNVRRQPPLCRR